MIRTNREEVVSAWAQGRGEDHRISTWNMRYEHLGSGEGLMFSYNAIIGYRSRSGDLYLYDGWRGFSPTTGTHLGIARRILESHYPDYIRVKDGRPRATLTSGIDQQGRPELASLSGERGHFHSK